mmetsp:Transcript_10184/g.15636  ORF Transcript_10184/g.15636 Transcript_10184/m.15636 type:complete len:100 (-) Transcript_10184:192-491(-)
MANALKSVLENGCCELHQSCLGVGTTNSDLSATRIKASSRPKTLTVDEGKWKINDNLCTDARGQIVNERLCHHAVNGSREEGDNGRILLFVFDTRQGGN